MALSRPVLLALVGAVVCGGLFFATMGARQSADDSGLKPAAKPANKPAAKQSPSPAKAKKQSAVATPTAAKKAQGKRRTPAAGTGGAAANARAAQAEARDAKPESAPSAGVPARVTSALARSHTVVLFFYQRGSADDDATAKAVDSLRGKKRVDVLSAPISRLADFRGVTGDAGVSQAPAVVILHGDRARLIEGFVDDATLAQEVADAR